MKTILITGINGYLGSQLAKRYSNSFNIIGLEYSKDNLFRLGDHSFELFESKYGIPDEIFDKHTIDCIIHTATFYGRELESDGKMLYSNTYLAQLLLEKAARNGCKLFINTDTVLDKFTSSYALTKKHFRDWLQFYAISGKIKVVNLEIEHFYGPGSSSSNFITLMTQKLLRNVKSIPLTKGEQNRDFLYIDDLLEVYDLILKRQRDFSDFETYNVGAGLKTNLKHILEYLKKNTSSSSILNFGAIPYRTNELMESNNDISKLTELGWYAKTSIHTGLSRVIFYEKSHVS